MLVSTSGGMSVISDEGVRKKYTNERMHVNERNLRVGEKAFSGLEDRFLVYRAIGFGGEVLEGLLIAKTNGIA